MVHIGRPHAAVPYAGVAADGGAFLREDPPNSGLFVPNITETTEDDDG